MGGPFFWVLGRNFRWGKKCPGGDYLGGFFPTAGGLPTAPAFALVQAPALGSIFGRGIQILIQVLCVCAKEGGIFHNFPFDPSAPHKSNNLTPRRTRPWMQKKKNTDNGRKGVLNSFEMQPTRNDPARGKRQPASCVLAGCARTRPTKEGLDRDPLLGAHFDPLPSN